MPENARRCPMRVTAFHPISLPPHPPIFPPSPQTRQNRTKPDTPSPPRPLAPSPPRPLAEASATRYNPPHAPIADVGHLAVSVGQINRRFVVNSVKKRFIIVGTGNRGINCWGKGLRNVGNRGWSQFPEQAEVVALVDKNPARGRAGAAEIGLPNLPVLPSVTEAQKAAGADWCIVTTPDRAHCQTVVEALEAGLNVLVDKPLATSAWECDQIIAASKRAGKQVIVGHNMRYGPVPMAAVKLMRQKVIGEVLHVEAAEVLDYWHGGDYFHRWHSDFSKSAGLMNHKCCHHLDVLCWLLDDEPAEVSAWGTRSYYREHPELNHGERCSNCPISAECPHYFDMGLSQGMYRRMYQEAEKNDGYVRDLCVFSERHTINDHEMAHIRFAKGAIASFSLVTFAPREHWYFHLTGTKGRLEIGSTSTDRKPFVRLIGLDGSVQEIATESRQGEGGHGGSDMRLMANVLGIGEIDPLQRATPQEARRAVMIADLCARSIAAGGRAVKAEEAGKDYPPAPPRPMSSPAGPLPLGPGQGGRVKGFL